MVCEVCRQIVIDPRRMKDFKGNPIRNTALAGGKYSAGPPRSDFYPDFLVLKTSGDAGCQLCLSIRTEILQSIQLKPLEFKVFDDTDDFDFGSDEEDDEKDDTKRGEWDKRIDISAPSIVFDRYWINRLVVQFGNREFLLQRTIAYDIQAHEDDPATTHGKIGPRPLDTVALSDRNTSNIKRWIDRCVEEHKHCSKNLDVVLPTRLIDVGEDDITAVSRLVYTKGQKGRYIALSHCWGLPTPSHPHFKTETHNLQERLNGIDFESLPLNFQDAIIVTRKLGLRHIWIDSLCIIQDDAADWEVEAADMGRIYSSAYLTIAATKSNSTHDGFLHRYKSISELVTMPYQAPEDSNVKGEFYLDPRSRSQARDIVSANWNKRGWTFQERLLSARVLHFCQDRICFECRGCDITEDNQAPHVSQQANWLHPDPGRPKQWMSPLEDEEPYRTYQIYHSMIQRYTEREFTFQTDLQPAILGLVNEMKRTVDDECIWGIWKKSFQRGLLWCRYDLDTSPEKADYLTRPLKKRAPSWSWISVNGSVSWNITRHRFSSQTQFGLKIIDTGITETSHPWELKVEAKLVRLSSCKERASWDQTVQLYWSDKKVGFGWPDLREPEFVGRRDIWLLEVESHNKGWDRDVNLAALLLEESGDNMNSFCRIGYAVVGSTAFEQTEPRTLILR